MASHPVRHGCQLSLLAPAVVLTDLTAHTDWSVHTPQVSQVLEDSYQAEDLEAVIRHGSVAGSDQLAQ